MEIELKYSIEDPADIDRLFSDPDVEKAKDENSVESVPMDAVYYDTTSFDLTKARIAFRVRKEGERYVGTLKWDGARKEALYRRHEINLTISDPEQQKHPTIRLFEQCDLGERLVKLVDGKELVPLVEMNFVRRKARLDTGKCIMEMSVDRGDINANKQISTILEAEFELLNGDEDDMVEFAQELAERYRMSPGEKSKFARGLELIGFDNEQ
jgi:triphosphatase